MKFIDHQYTKTPFFGSRKIVQALAILGVCANRKRIQRLMQRMGLEAIYPKKKLSGRGHQHRIFPYLLRGLRIAKPDQVWSTDITYIPMAFGFMFLTAVIDWFSRYVLSWRLSNTIDSSFCVDALKAALRYTKPKIFNSDQGAQFTGRPFISTLQKHEVNISMDSRGRALDNIFVERLWRTVKYENIYLREYTSGLQLRKGLTQYFKFYNNDRPHQALGYKTPSVIYFAGKGT